MPEVKIAKAELYRSHDGWRWRAKGGNGEIVAEGEAYTRRDDALAAARAVVGSDMHIQEVKK